MFIRKYTKFVVFTITVLVATLLSEVVIWWLEPEKSYKGIVIRMAVIVLIYVPVLNLMEASIKKSAQKLADKSKKIGKNRLLGLSIGFAVALVLLFFAFSIILNGEPISLK